MKLPEFIKFRGAVWNCWKKNKTPTEWEYNIIISTHNGNSQYECNNY